MIFKPYVYAGVTMWCFFTIPREYVTHVFQENSKVLWALCILIHHYLWRNIKITEVHKNIWKGVLEIIDGFPDRCVILVRCSGATCGGAAECLAALLIDIKINRRTREPVVSLPSVSPGISHSYQHQNTRLRILMLWSRTVLSVLSGKFV